MIYVALLRGINVGGNNKVEMSKLKMLFEGLGFTNVKTYINSGNVVFKSDLEDSNKLANIIEITIEKKFTLPVKVVVRNLENIRALNVAIPKSWANNSEMKTDVIFLWPEIDSMDVLKQIKFKPEIESVKYFHGTVVWHVARKNTHPGSLIQVVKSDFYKKSTIRNINTVRKLLELMLEATKP